MIETNEYDLLAEKFLKDTKTTMDVKFLTHGKHFQDDKEDRDIYCVIFTKGNKHITVMYGQSIAHSGRYIVRGTGKDLFLNDKKGIYKYTSKEWSVTQNKAFQEPRAYDVLSSLTKSNPEDFDTFCAEYGYDTDSIKALNTYNAVVKEWKDVEYLWSPEDIEKLLEIQ